MEQRAPRRRRPLAPGRPSWLEGTTRLVAFGTTLVAAVSGTVTLIFVLLPSLKPSPPAAVVSAELRLVDQLVPTTFRDYLAQTGRDPSSYPSAQLDCDGALAFVHVAVEGQRGVRSSFTYSLLRVPRALLTGSGLNERAAGGFDPPADRYSGIVKIWVPFPPHPGQFLARIELDNKSNVLGFADTRPFVVPAGRQCAGETPSAPLPSTARPPALVTSVSR
jgi:hypothetical protein